MPYARQFQSFIERLCYFTEWILESREDRSCQTFRTFTCVLQAIISVVAIRSSCCG